MLKLKRIISLFLILATIATMAIAGNAAISTSAAGTGTGLAEHALNAYYSKWSYVYGGASAGAVDCSGLIYMYAGGNRTNMLGASSVSGYVSGGIPNIHGLGLYQPGHVGVYVGNGMAVDARSEGYGVCYQSAYTKNWTHWFKVAGVSYPTNGWEYFNGNYYYYQNGEYLTNTSVTIDGITYYLDASGASSSTPGDTSGVVDSSSSSSSSSSSGSTSSSASSVMKVGSYGDNVIKLQNRLTELGFYNGDVTGYFGEQTEAAYIRFQKAAGVYVDGIAGASDLEILYSDYAPTGTVADATEPAESTDTTTTTTAIEDTTEEATAPSTYTNGTYHDNVYKIQTELANLGYFNDDATGYYGELTESAVVKFQLENGLETTGDVDELTYTTLFSSRALENPYTEDSADRTIVRNPNSDNATEETTAPESTTSPAATTVPATVSPTEATDIVLKSAQLASKALEGVNVQVEETSSNSSNNGSFLVWFVVMIAFMSTAFWIVFSTEKKKKKARYERIKARANRNW